MKVKQLLTLFLFLTAALSSQAQTTFITIGTGTNTNNNTNYPAPYGNWYFGAKHQMIILASELSAQGMSAGDIYSLGLQVASAQGAPLTNFTIGMQLTSATDVNGPLATGFTTVYGPQTYTESNGWNTHNFSSPFYWDGTSNLLIETCFNNSNYTGNAEIMSSSTTFESTVVYRDDATGVCSATPSPWNLNTYTTRPNIRLEWQVPNIPPVAEFTVSSTSTCSGNVQFFDQSTNSPTSWFWDFGDGNTSTAQNPTHSYISGGTYNVSLTATNAFGNDTEVKNNYVTVNLSGATPVAASCTPITGDGSLGFGITNVTFNTLNVTSGNASEGYSDFTCDQTTVFAGHTYNISIDHASPTFHNCAAWIDFNNDGILDNNTELIISNSSALGTSGSVTIPSSATLNTPLRMRIIADYDLNPMPTPCLDPDYGQAEDFTIIVEQDSTPPVVDFEADILHTCDGVVNFTDLSTNIPFAWAWDFGDGNTSVQQNPTHTYVTDGIFDVELIATNQFGSVTHQKTMYIEVSTANNLTIASCSPQTLANCCGYGIYKVELNNINNVTNDGEDGYQDYSCDHSTDLQMNNTYQLKVRTGADNPQDTKAWIDYNDDGIFDDATEMVLNSVNDYDPVQNITIPNTGVVTNTRLRMRVSSDEVGSGLTSCSDNARGQTEDYAVSIMPAGIDTPAEVEFQIFPNPASEEINIQSVNESLNRVRILNLVGQTVFEMIPSIGSKFININIADLSTGTYLVEVEAMNGQKSVKKVTIK